MICDHSDDAQVEALFKQVERESGGLDILVNNAFTIPDGLSRKGPFWEKPLALQSMFDVGMRSAYVASYYAAPLLIKNNAGLVVNTSSFGGRCYMHGPAYGAGKAAVDKMAHDMAVDFKPYDVAAVSLWMGLLKTERNRALFEGVPERYQSFAAGAETPEFSGRVIDALARHPDRMRWTGQVLIGAELGAELGVTDLDGRGRTRTAPCWAIRRLQRRRGRLSTCCLARLITPVTVAPSVPHGDRSHPYHALSIIRTTKLISSPTAKASWTAGKAPP